MRDFSNTPSVEIYTLHDLVHRLTIRTQSDASVMNKALFVRAIQDAIRGLPGKHDWKYFQRQSRFRTSPRIEATVSYDHTGGSVERLLTITDGVNVWPEDVGLGEVYIEDVEQPFRVLKRISDTEVQLEPGGFSLDEDYTGAMKWGRKAYAFNREVVKVLELKNITLDRPIAFMSSVDFQSAVDSHYGYGATEIATFQNHGSYFGSTDFVLAPMPTAENIIEVTAVVNPLIPKIESVRGTTGGVAAGSNTFTDLSGTFTDKLIGSVIRLSSDNTTPTEFNSDNYDFQAFVVSVTDANNLVLSESPTTSFSSVGYNISSPIDIEASVMLEYVEDEAFFQYAKNHDHTKLNENRVQASISMRLAMVRDNKVSLNSDLWVPFNSTNWWLGGGFYELVRSSG